MKRARGFTLLEVVVALAVTAAVLVVLQRATADALRARARLGGYVERRGAIRATLAHLVREVAGAVPGTLRIERPAAASASLLEFALDEPAPLLVRYRLEVGRLERLTRPRFGAGAPDGAPVVLLPDVTGLEVRARDGEGWHPRWEATHAPLLLAFELALATGERLATTVPLPTGAQP